MDNGRYTVNLSRKEHHPLLVNNNKQAEKRVIAVEKSLQRNSKKCKAYREAIKQYITDGHVRDIIKNDEYVDKILYLPHHAVFVQTKPLQNVE